MTGPPDEPRKFCLDCNYPLDGLRDARCPECGRLFDPQDPQTFGFHLNAPVQVYSARDGMEAHFLRSLLLAEGIAATVVGEALGMARGDLPMTAETLPSVWVSRDDVEAAMPILAEFSKKGAAGDEPAGDEWTCPGCGELIEGQFAVCWNCQTPRPQEQAQPE